MPPPPGGVLARLVALSWLAAATQAGAQMLEDALAGPGLQVVEFKGKERVKVGVVLVVSPAAKPQVNMAHVTRDLSAQPAKYFDWASYGKLTLETTVTTVDGPAEKDAAGTCIPELAPDFAGLAPTFDPSLYDVVVWYNYNAECGGSCSANVGTMRCTKLVGMSVCDDGEYALCDLTYVHELEHTLGFGWHQNGVRCTEAQKRANANWRDCAVVEYGNPADVLGSGTTSHKVSLGTSAHSRYQMAWLTAADITTVSANATVVLQPLTATSGTRAVVVRFTGSLASLDALWVEYRVASGYDGGLATRAGGFNAGGVFISNAGTALLDVQPDLKPPKLPVPESFVRS